MSKLARTPQVLFVFFIVRRIKFIKHINKFVFGDIMADECIFCKIIAGEVTCSKVYEDEDTLAFLDIAPNNFGHTLVIPKSHHEALLETPDEVLSKLMVASKKVARAVMVGTGCKGFNFNQNNYKVAGQLVPHVHFHIIPRLEDDGFEFWSQKKYDEGEIEEYRKKIESAFK